MLFRKKCYLEKFFLAKRLAGVYIDRAKACVMTMKKIFSSLILALAVGGHTLQGAGDEKSSKWAMEATDVCANLVATPTIDVQKIEVDPTKAPDVKKMFKSMDEKTLPAKGDWYVIHIPIEIRAIGRSKGSSSSKLPARIVDELKVKAHVLIRKGTAKSSSDPKAEDYFILSKEVVYSDILMEETPKKGPGFSDKDGDGYKKIYVSLFVSPEDALRLSDNPNDSKAKKLDVEGYAVDITFKGDACRQIPRRNPDDDSPVSLIVKSKTQSYFKKKSAKWWQSAKTDETAAKLRTVDETPWAATYKSIYPTIKAADSASSGSSSSSSESSSSSTSTTADDE